jgi:hypothetical protein
MFRKNFDGYGSVQTGVCRSIHLAHTSCSDLILDGVRAEFGAGFHEVVFAETKREKVG